MNFKERYVSLSTIMWIHICIFKKIDRIRNVNIYQGKLPRECYNVYQLCDHGNLSGMTKHAGSLRSNE